jgi:hypothetical protein
MLSLTRSRGDWARLIMHPAPPVFGQRWTVRGNPTQQSIKSTFQSTNEFLCLKNSCTCSVVNKKQTNVSDFYLSQLVTRRQAHATGVAPAIMLLWVRHEKGAGSIYRHRIGREDRSETAGGGRGGHRSGGANSRAKFNLFRAGKRRFHAHRGDGWSVTPLAVGPQAGNARERALALQPAGFARRRRARCCL